MIVDTPSNRESLVRRGRAVTGTSTELDLAYFVYRWFATHPNIPRPRDAYAALEVYLSYTEPRI